jgi:phosphate transport system permease protein
VEIFPHSRKLNAGTTFNLRRYLNHGDRPWQWLLIGSGLLVTTIILIVAIMLWRDSAATRQANGIGFLALSFDADWNPVTDVYMAWPFIYGTLLTSLTALVIALPISLGVAIFLAELSPEWLRRPIGSLVELLAAVPSVVFGLWGIYTFLPGVVVPIGNFLGAVFGSIPGVNLLFQGPIPESGVSRLAAGLILAIMIVPTIASVSRDVFLAIPRAQREASLALGATTWETIWQVLLPYGLSGILGAVILGLGRALGETMAVTMVIGNSIESSPSLLRPGYTMASVIANQFAEAVSAMHSSALIEIGLILFLMSLGLNLVARLLVWRVARRTPQEGR